MDEEIDEFPTVTLVSELKDRLQAQQRIVKRTATPNDVPVLSIRAELDALWECVEVIAQFMDGIPHDRVLIHDYFSGTAPKRRKWWQLPKTK